MLYACKKKRVFEFKKKEGERQELYKKKKLKIENTKGKNFLCIHV